MSPIGIVWVGEPKLLCCRSGDFYTAFGQPCRLILCQIKAKRLGLNNDKAIAPKRGINCEGAKACNLKSGIQLTGKTWQVLYCDPFGFAIAAVGAYFDQPAGGLEGQFGHRFLHWQDASI